MTHVTYRVVQHDGGWAYKVDGVLGSAMIRGQIAIFLDIDRLLQIWSGIQGITTSLPTPRLPEAARRKVLIVEDTQFFQKLITSHLESDGFEVTLAGHGGEGLEKLQSGTFDLVISDIEMPVMDGFNFARKVRENPRYASLPLLALTTLSDSDSRNKAAVAGFDAFEVKLDRASLLATVHGLLTRRRSTTPALLQGGPTHA